MEQTQKIIIYDALETLQEKEQSIIKLYYLAGFTEFEIAESYQISQQAIHKIKKRALEKCRKELERKKLKYVNIV
jgi:RNA polymerase sigma factor (sigma-70 family)